MMDHRMNIALAFFQSPKTMRRVATIPAIASAMQAKRPASSAGIFAPECT